MKKQEMYEIVALLSKTFELPEVHNDEEIRIEVAEFIAKANSKLGKISFEEANYLYSNIFFYIIKIRKLSYDSIYELIMNHLITHSSLNGNTIEAYAEAITSEIDFAYNQCGSSANPYLWGVTNEPNDNIIKYDADQNSMLYTAMLALTRASECCDLPAILLQAMYLMECEDTELLRDILSLNNISFNLEDKLEEILNIIEKVWVSANLYSLEHVDDNKIKSFLNKTDINHITYIHVVTHTLAQYTEDELITLKNKVYNSINEILSVVE